MRNIPLLKAINAPIQIVPNPASDHAIIYFPLLSASQTLTISDEKGAILFTQNLAAGTDLFVVTTTTFADGRYIVEIGTLTSKLIILKEQ